jgi:hypothetical protein
MIITYLLRENRTTYNSSGRIGSDGELVVALVILVQKI